MGSTSPEFSAATVVEEFDVLLFDMDGTIIDSTPAIVKHWLRIGEEIGVDGNVILQTSHGRRSIDVLAILAPHLANWEYVREAESRIPIEYGSDAIEIPGSRALLDRLEAVGAPWAIVTSGTQPLVAGWQKVMGLAAPRSLVTAEDVAHGKPDPACYLLGAKRLLEVEEERLAADTAATAASATALSSTTTTTTTTTSTVATTTTTDQSRKAGQRRTLVLEDAPSGVRAGKAAGFEVIGLATTHTVEEVRAAGADWIVRDLRSVQFVRFDPVTKKVRLEIRDGLVGL